MATTQKSGSSGDGQKQPVQQSASSMAGAAHVKGGATVVAAGPKGGARPQSSGSKGG